MYTYLYYCEWVSEWDCFDKTKKIISTWMSKWERDGILILMTWEETSVMVNLRIYVHDYYCHVCE